MSTVAVIVPAYNEGPALAANLVVLADYLAVHAQSFDSTILLVDDGSTDDTFAAMQTFARYRGNVRVLKHERNYGVGRAIRTALAATEATYALVLDADLSYSPHLAITLLEELEQADADVSVASAYMRGGSVKNVPFVRRVLSREANRILSLAAKGRCATFTCMVRAYRTAFLKTLAFREDGMEAGAEILLCALRSGARVLEIPARLEWTAERRASRAMPALRKTVRQTWNTLRLAFGFRPALWLAVPGLFPGLLPLVVAFALLLHASASTLAIATAATIAVQYTSLAIFAGQLGAFFARALSRRSSAQKALYL